VAISAGSSPPQRRSPHRITRYLAGLRCSGRLGLFVRGDGVTASAVSWPGRKVGLAGAGLVVFAAIFFFAFVYPQTPGRAAKAGAELIPQFRLWAWMEDGLPAPESRGAPIPGNPVRPLRRRRPKTYASPSSATAPSSTDCFRPKHTLGGGPQAPACSGSPRAGAARQRGAPRARVASGPVLTRVDLPGHRGWIGMVASGSYGQRTTLAQQAATHTPFFPLRFTDIKAASARSNSSSAVVPSSPVATPIERVIAPIP
jgi:hypothetical protein